MHALHQAARQNGKTNQPLTIRQWETLVIAWFGMRSRQSVHDITWGMDRAGMIEWRKGKSVSFLDQDPFTSNDPGEGPPSPVASSA